MSVPQDLLDISTSTLLGEGSSLPVTIMIYSLIAYLLLLAPTVVYFFRRPSAVSATTTVAIFLLLISTSMFQNVHSHVFYLLAVASKLFAPLLLGLTALAHYNQVQKRSGKSTPSLKVFTTILNVPTIIFFIFQVEVLCCYVVGLFNLVALHSAKPIDGMSGALGRLSHEKWSVSFIGAGMVLQLVAFLGMAFYVTIEQLRQCFSCRPSATAADCEVETRLRRQTRLDRVTVWATCITLASLCVSPVYKLALIYSNPTFSSEVFAPLQETGVDALYDLALDNLPTLLATVALVMQNTWGYEKRDHLNYQYQALSHESADTFYKSCLLGDMKGCTISDYLA